MDNISRTHRSRYLHAYKLAEEGKRAECLDILWELRLRPDLSLYRRALVNLLIATLADLRRHPDIRKFGEESEYEIEA